MSEIKQLQERIKDLEKRMERVEKFVERQEFIIAINKKFRSGEPFTPQDYENIKRFGVKVE